MRIISKYKDYYDSAQAFGADPNIVYVREQERFDYESPEWSWREGRNSLLPRLNALRPLMDSLFRLPNKLTKDVKYGLSRDNMEIPITTKLLGFCGKLYPALEIENTTFYTTSKISSALSIPFLKQHGLDTKKLDEILERKENSSWCTDKLSHETWKRYSGPLINKRHDDVFVELGVPIFVIAYGCPNDRKKQSRPNTLICELNPQLKPHEFQKVIGPAEAFQELAMYVGNQLARQPDPISTVSDEILRDEKGFNEWSFRRHKEEDKKFKKKMKNE
ncbi:MAG: hypothetical protein SGI88_12300 [Candidatus Hydrogenedentes bacterium]|nr:hypothetical protein [Candidatus Hydrogenedentota bacterium]